MRNFLLAMLLFVLSVSPSEALPSLSNPDFAGGLTGWNTAGTVTTGNNPAFGGGFYAQISLAGGLNLATTLGALGVGQADLEGALGVAPGGLTNFRFAFVDQLLQGPYAALDTLQVNVSGLSDGAGNVLVMLGMIDTSNGTFANVLDNVPMQFLAPGQAGFGGFANFYGPRGPEPMLVGTTNSVRFVALIADDAGSSENAALLFSSPVPEIDPASAGLPLLVACGLILLGERRSHSSTAP